MAGAIGCAGAGPLTGVFLGLSFEIIGPLMSYLLAGTPCNNIFNHISP